MRSFIVDTDVVSYIYKGDTRGELYENHLSVSLSFISFMTLAELDLWAESHSWGETKKRGTGTLFTAVRGD